MRLYLVQHAKAKRKEEDSSRPLSEKGWETIRKVAAHAERNLHIEINKIFHSGKLRAKQTAEVLGDHLNPVNGVLEADGLDSLADPKIWKDYLAETSEDIMVVGHLPHLNKLAADLLAGDQDRKVVSFEMAGIVCLERDERGCWSVKWIVTPEIIS